jgi:hypothetical protein
VQLSELREIASLAQGGERLEREHGRYLSLRRVAVYPEVYPESPKSLRQKVFLSDSQTHK